MSILPRTRRGVWLSAAVLWLAGCGWLWWLVPPVPRAEHRFDQGKGEPSVCSVGPTFVASYVDDEARWELLAWNAATGGVTSIPDTTGASFARHSPDGRWIAFCNHDPVALVRDLVAGRSYRIPVTVNLPRAIDFAMEFGPDSRTLAVTGVVDAMPVVKLYGLPPDDEPHVLPWATRHFEFSADGRRIACILQSQSAANCREDIGVWSVADGSRLGAVNSLRVPVDVAPDVAHAIIEHYQAACGFNSSKVVYKRTSYQGIDRDGRELWSTEFGTAGRLLDGGRRLILADEPGRVVRDTADGRVLQTYDLSSDADLVVAFSPDGRTAAVVGDASGVSVWVNGWLQQWGVPWQLPWSEPRLWTVDLPTGWASGSLSAEPKRVEFAADGKSLSVVHADATCRVWDVQPPKSLSWFAAGAATWAAPLALLACWRVRRIALRAAA